MPRWGAQETIGNINMDKAKEDDKKEEGKKAGGNARNKTQIVEEGGV